MYGIRKIGDTGLPNTFCTSALDEFTIEHTISSQHFAMENIYLLSTREKAQAVLDSNNRSFGYNHETPSLQFDPKEYEVVEIELSIS